MARANSRSAGLKTYWKTVHAVAHRTDRSIGDARAIVRAGRARELTHTELRTITPQYAGTLKKLDDQRKADEREKEIGGGPGGGFEPPEPPEQVYDDLDRWIDEYDEYNDFDPPEDYDANPDYTPSKGGK